MRQVTPLVPASQGQRPNLSRRRYGRSRLASFWMPFVALLVAGSPATARASTPMSRTSERHSGPLRTAVTVRDSTLEASSVVAAVSAELGRELVPVSQRTRGGSLLIIDVAGAYATVSFRASEGSAVGRSIELPEDSTRALETLALLASNVVRNEAAELLDELVRKAEAAQLTAVGTPDGTSTPAVDANTEPPPAPEESEQSDHPAGPLPAPTEPASPDPAPANRSSAPDAEVNLSLWHPLALYGDSHERRVHLELGLAYGHVGTIEGFALTSGVLRADHGLRGVAMAGLGAWTAGGWQGLSVGGLLAGGTGSAQGVQVAGLATMQLGRTTDDAWGNWGEGEVMDGAQFSVLFNYNAGALRGMQVGTLNMNSGDVEGAQVAILNLTKGRLDGIQGGILNLASLKHSAADPGSRGAQAGVVNIAAASLTGAQLGVTNVVADRLRGTQVGVVNLLGAPSRGAQVGVVNLAVDQQGAQIGIVNVARTRQGFQLGLINVSRHSTGVFLGLLTLAENVDTSLMTYASTLTPLNIGLKSAAPWYFTRVQVGTDLRDLEDGGGDSALRSGFALGSSIPLTNGGWFLEPGLEYSHVLDTTAPQDRSRHLTGPEASLSYKPSPHFGAFGGAAARFEGNESWRPLFEAFVGLELL